MAPGLPEGPGSPRGAGIRPRDRDPPEGPRSPRGARPCPAGPCPVPLPWRPRLRREAMAAPEGREAAGLELRAAIGFNGTGAA